MEFWKKSLFVRILFSFLFTVILGLAVVCLIISFLTKDYIYDNAKQDLLRKGSRVNAAIQHLSDPTSIQKELTFLDESFNARIWVFDKQGKIIQTSVKDEVSIGKSVHPSIVERVINGETPVNELKFKGLTEPMLSVVVPWGIEDEIYGGIVLHSPIIGFEKTISNFRETILWTTLLGIFISTAMVSYLSWSISRPLRNIDRVAMEIGMGNYSKRIDYHSNDEIGDLSKTINTLAMQLEEVEQKRQKHDQIKNDFLANVSHELRTPLTAIQGFLEALQDRLVTDEQGRQKYYGVMYHEMLHMSRLIDDLMMLIKLESDELQLYKQPVNVGHLITKTTFKFRQEAESKGINLSRGISNEKLTAYGDPDRLEQILDNLLKNAIKFTEQGQIDLKTIEVGSYVIIQVTDTGIGIASQDLDRVWERFFKVDRSRTKNVKGTGLGLAIVKELVDIHNGKIEVESTIGKGTTFKVWIPSGNHEQEKLTS
jgi:signal transduction histidine kinase